MADTATIASLATAGGTLVLAIATFSSTRSANRSARIAEQSLRAGLRPVLFNARQQDPPQKVGFADDHWVRLRDGLASVEHTAETLYLAVHLRNAGSGLAVLHGWHLWPERATEPPPPAESFRRLTRDIYVPAGDVGFWQGAVRGADDPLHRAAGEAVGSGAGMSLDLLYGDHEGGQRTITRFFLAPRAEDGEEPALWRCSTARHWNLDRPDPR